MKIKNPLLYSRGQEIPVVPPQFTPTGPHGILTDPQAVPGPTRLRLLTLTIPFQRSHSERNSTPCTSLPCSHRQLSGRWKGACTGFHHRVLYILCGYCLVYHFSLFKSIRNFQKITQFDLQMALKVKWLQYRILILPLYRPSLVRVQGIRARTYIIIMYTTPTPSVPHLILGRILTNSEKAHHHRIRGIQ